MRNLYAVLVGVNGPECPPDGARRLEWAERDAEDIARLLRYNFPNDRERITVLRGEQATSQQVCESIRDQGEAGADDLVVIYLGGHGVPGRRIARDGTVPVYFATYDMDPDAPARTALSMTHLHDLTRELSREANVFLVLDACFSGKAAEYHRTFQPPYRVPAGQLDDPLRLGDLDGTVVLAACGPSHQAAESPTLQHGLLTEALIRCTCSTSAAGPDLYVDTEKLMEAVGQRVGEQVAMLKQTPSGELPGDFEQEPCHSGEFHRLLFFPLLAPPAWRCAHEPSAAAWTTTRLPPVDGLVGRAAELDELLTHLRDPGVQRVLVWGQSLVGKSSLVATAVHELLREGREVLWLNGTGLDLPLMRTLAAERLQPAWAGPPSSQVPATSCTEPAGLGPNLYESLNQSQCTVVVDHFERVQDVGVRDSLLGMSEHASNATLVLVSSDARTMDGFMQVGVAKRLPIGPLSEDEAKSAWDRWCESGPDALSQIPWNKVQDATDLIPIHLRQLRELARRRVVEAALGSQGLADAGPTYFYEAVYDCLTDGAKEMVRCQRVLRVPRTRGLMDSFFRALDLGRRHGANLDELLDDLRDSLLFIHGEGCYAMHEVVKGMVERLYREDKHDQAEEAGFHRAAITVFSSYLDQDLPHSMHAIYLREALYHCGKAGMLERRLRLLEEHSEALIYSYEVGVLRGEFEALQAEFDRSSREGHAAEDRSTERVTQDHRARLFVQRAKLARKCFQPVEMQQWCKEGLDLDGVSEGLREALECLKAESLMMLNEDRRAHELLCPLLQRARDRRDHAAVSRIQQRVSDILLRLGCTEEALSAANASLDEVERIEDKPAACHGKSVGLLRRAQALTAQGDHGRARLAARRCLEAQEEGLGVPDALGQAAARIVYAEAALGKRERISSLAAAAEGQGNEEVWCRTALDMATTALHVLEQRGLPDRYWIGGARRVIGTCHGHLRPGDFAAAEEHIAEAVGMATQDPIDRYRASQALLAQGQLHAAQNRWGEAADSFASAYGHAAARGYHAIAYSAASQAAQAHAQAANHAKAAQCHDEAVEHAQTIGLHAQALDACRAGAVLAARTGHTEEASQRLARFLVLAATSLYLDEAWLDEIKELLETWKTDEDQRARLAEALPETTRFLYTSDPCGVQRLLSDCERLVQLVGTALRCASSGFPADALHRAKEVFHDLSFELYGFANDLAGRSRSSGRKRDHPRLRTILKGEARVVGSSGDWLPIETIDISRGGACLATSTPLQEGAKLDAKITLGGGELQLPRGTVVRSPFGHEHQTIQGLELGAAIQFDEQAPPESRADFDAFVSALEDPRGRL